MRPYAPPVLGSPRLGQIGNLLTQDIASQIVSAADAPTRAIIRDERNRLSEGLIGGLPFAALSGVSAVGTYYLVPEEAKLSKFIGYGISFISLGIGGLWTFSKITERVVPQPPSGPAPAVVQQAAQSIVEAADPKIRQIVEEERARIAAAAQTALPFVGASAIGAIATAIFVSDERPEFKVVGYSVSVLIAALGAWIGLEKEQG